MMIEILLAISAIASAVAALSALFVAWKAPKAAAQFAEDIKSRNENSKYIQSQKMFIFSELMKARGVQITREAVAAFNLIDLVFLESTTVRDAWAELYSAYSKAGNHSGIVDDKLNFLLREMAADVGLSADLRPADLERYYYPNALANEDNARSAQLKVIIDSIPKDEEAK
jgi:hypothetical protein